MSRGFTTSLIVVLMVLAGMPKAEIAGDTESEFWALKKPLRSSVPDKSTLKYGNRVQSPIDAFVFSRLDEYGLDPAPMADKHTLIRRAYFDLIGLPPTLEQVDKFINNTSADAWPTLINELLDSKQYGERWGRHWLDVARYADSGGYETDIYWRNAWRYRDYVVESFNDDQALRSLCTRVNCRRRAVAGQLRPGSEECLRCFA